MGEPSIVFVVEKNGRPDIKERLLFSESTTSLKLEKANGMISAYFRPEAKAWATIMRLDSLTGIEQGIMLYTFSGNAATPRMAKFSDFQLNVL
ncbi:hypothetical protein RCJ22_26635 [Vibrio sp. FNV 38]|nr:hypothetical protein [Vibrio sp. FNV 38]